jgi:small subunit ribosomal protein S4
MRYTGPRAKKARRLGQAFTEKAARILQRRPSPPGQHGQGKGKPSEFALQMREKQRIKYAYGVSEDQFYKAFLLSQKEKGATGDNLMRRLERRLDNVVYRLGLATTRAQARQLVGHGFITVNAKPVNIASFLIKVGDVVGVKANKQKSAYIAGVQDKMKENSKTPDWLSWSTSDMTGKVLSLPDAKQHAEPVDSRLVVEHYQRI